MLLHAGGMSSSIVSSICEELVRLGIQNNLPDGRNGADHRADGEDDGDGGVEPEDKAPFGRLEGDVVEDGGDDEVEGQVADGSQQSVEVAEEGQHGGKQGGGDDRERAEDSPRH